MGILAKKHLETKFVKVGEWLRRCACSLQHTAQSDACKERGW